MAKFQPGQRKTPAQLRHEREAAKQALKTAEKPAEQKPAEQKPAEKPAEQKPFDGCITATVMVGKDSYSLTSGVGAQGTIKFAEDVTRYDLQLTTSKLLSALISEDDYEGGGALLELLAMCGYDVPQSMQEDVANLLEGLAADADDSEGTAGYSQKEDEQAAQNG